METKICKACGGEFTTNPRYSAAQRERTVYCSRRCQSAGSRLQRPFCACGCGERVAKPHSRYRPGHNPQTWRLKAIKFDGRRWYVYDRKGRKVYWARIVLQNKLGRALRAGEIAHHLNGDRTDDRPENIDLHSSHSEHMREHHAHGDLHRVDWRDRWA